MQQVLVDEIYSPTGLVEDVATFCQYNANKALMILSQDPIFDIEDGDVNPVVLNGLNTKTKDHDYFSMKNNGYQRITIEPIQDADFEF